MGFRLCWSLALTLALALDAVAAPRYAASSGEWQAITWTSNGCGGKPVVAAVPTSIDAVTICNGITVSVTNANASAASIVFLDGNASSTVNINTGRTLTVAGHIDISASANNTTRRVAVNAGGTLSVGGNVTLNTLAAGANRDTEFVITGAAGPTASATVGGTLIVQNCDADSNSTVQLAGTGNASLTVNGAVSVSSTGCSISTGAGTLNFNAALTIGANGTLSNNTGTVNLKGNLTHTGTLNANTGTFVFNGSAAQQLLGTAATTAFYNLQVANPAGLTLGHGASVGNVLTLASGVVSTGANVLDTTASCTMPSVSRTAGWVAGNLRKRFPAGAPITCAFEIGDAASYTPVSVTFTAVTAAGSLQARTDNIDHPDTTGGTSGINASKSVNRYWTLALPAGSTLAFAGNTYSATFNFIAGSPVDLDSGADTALFVVARKNLGAWSLPTVGTRTATSTQATGIAPADGFGEFAIGQPQSLVDHYQISHSGGGQTCEGEQVTISMHDASHALVAGATTITIRARRVSGVPAANKGDWSLVTGTSANFSNGAADDGEATYTFAAGETSVVLRYTNTWTQTVNLDVVDQNNVTESSGTGGAHSDADMVFQETGFVFSTIGTQTAGTTSATYTLTAVTTGSQGAHACKGTFTGNVANIELAFECLDPTACQPGQLVTFTNNGSGTIAGNPAGSVTSYTTRNVSFSGSEASFTIDYPDVGQIRLHARYTIPLGSGSLSGTVMTGASNAFVVKPAGFSISDIKLTSNNSVTNPGAADAGGMKFAKAGEAFTLTVRSLNSLGNATPNYGKEVSPEGVLLTPTLVGGLGLTATGTVSNATIAGTEFGATGAVNDANGDATITNLSWSEVGIMRLTPSVGDGSYLGAGDVTGTTTGNIGRFYPDHFAVSAVGTLVPACSTATAFTYLGQPLAVSGVALEARNAMGNKTQNYHGSFAKHPPATAANWGFAARDIASGTNLTATAARPWSATIAGSWNLGSLAANITGLTISRLTAATPEGPYTNASIGVAPYDSDGVAMKTADLDLDVDAVGGNDHKAIGGAGAVYRFGRLRLENAAGQGHLALPLRVSTQYWTSGNVFVTNTDDGCTTLPAKSFLLSGHFGGITAANLPTPTPGSDGAVSVAGSFVSGVGNVRLNAPSPIAATPGAVNLCIDLDGTCGAATSAAMPWLRGLWSNGTAYTDNPRARATYGLYGSQPRNFIFHRENY